DHYRDPINDSVVLSGISGYLNILDIPTYSKEVALLGYRIAGEIAPEALNVAFGEVHFDFELPGSTHNFRLSDPFFCSIQHSDKHVHSGSGSLEILMDRMVRGDQCKLFYKPFYCRDEFSDERYSPVFTPTAYSGQTVRMKLYLDQWNGWETVGIAPYVRTMSNKKDHLQGYIKLVQEQWLDVEFTIPDTEGDLVDEVGIVIEGYAPGKSKTLGMIYLDSFSITGKSKYTIAIQKQKSEFGTITPFAVDHGAWAKEEGKLSLMSCEPSFAYAGNYYSKNYTVSTTITPLNGDSHLVLARAQGAMRGYAFGLTKDNTVALYKNHFGWQPLATAGFNWQLGQTYPVSITVKGSSIQCSINGTVLAEVQDDTYEYGMFGCGALGIGRAYYGDFAVTEIE
ncbi:MAG: ADP-ribosylglycohydrolase family protein, partial [Oscillospiraceae bacterium]